MENSKVIRAAQIIGKMMGGGVESVVMNYYRHIDKSKIQFDFIIDEDSTVVPREEIESMGGKIYTVPPYQKITEYIPALTKLFKENGYQIVHSHLNTLSVFPLYAAKKAGVPVRIAHNHSTAGKGETKKNILKYTLRPFAKLNATHYAACGKYAGEWLFGSQTVKKNKVMIFNNAVDVDKFKYNETIRNKIRNSLGITDKFVVGHIGRFVTVKNHKFLVDLFSEIHSSNPNSVLMLIGQGNIKNQIKEYAHKLDLDKCVMFLGQRKDVAELYQAMDVFVLPSFYEGLPVVGVEAQIAGLPCVFSSAVTKEILMTPNSVMLDLDSGIEKWKNVVLSSQNARLNSKETFADFDIKKQVEKLAEFYLKIQTFQTNI